MERSQLFKPDYAKKWAQYDPKLANKLLDEVGLTKKDGQGFRLLPDGRPATIVVEHASEETEDADALHLIAEMWKKVGIKMLTKPQTRENFRLRAFSGEAIMTAFAGVVTAMPTPNTSPKEFAPTMQGGLQWSRWGMFVESKERMGEKCDVEAACKLLDYVKEWETGNERGGAAQGVGEDPDRQRRRGLHHRHGERHPPAGRGRPEDQERAQGRLLRLGSGRIYRPLPAGHVLGGAVAQRRASRPAFLLLLLLPRLRGRIQEGAGSRRVPPISDHDLFSGEIVFAALPLPTLPRMTGEEMRGRRCLLHHVSIFGRFLCGLRGRGGASSNAVATQRRESAGSITSSTSK